MSRAPYGKLTGREKDALRSILEGKNQSQIATALGVSTGRVNNLLTSAREKMLAGTNREAANTAKAIGQI